MLGSTHLLQPSLSESLASLSNHLVNWSSTPVSTHLAAFLWAFSAANRSPWQGLIFSDLTCPIQQPQTLAEFSLYLFSAFSGTVSPLAPLDFVASS